MVRTKYLSYSKSISTQHTSIQDTIKLVVYGKKILSYQLTYQNFIFKMHLFNIQHSGGIDHQISLISKLSWTKEQVLGQPGYKEKSQFEKTNQTMHSLHQMKKSTTNPKEIMMQHVLRTVLYNLKIVFYSLSSTLLI